MFFQGVDARTFCHFYCKLCSKTGIFIFQKPKSFKNLLNVSKLRGKFQKLNKKHKTQGKNYLKYHLDGFEQK